MYPNHIALERMTKARMEEDRTAAEYTQFVHPSKIRLDLMIWQERIWDLLESLEAVRKDLDRKGSSLQDSV
jgi:hypothetical protein